MTDKTFDTRVFSELYKPFMKISGVYIISKGDRSYIGSSENVGRRIRMHLGLLIREKHYNKDFQADWTEYADLFHSSLLVECGENSLLWQEHEIIDSHTGSLYNKNIYRKDTPEEISMMWGRISKRIMIRPNDCWEFTGRTGKDGYGRVRRKIQGKTKEYDTHRVSYMFHNEDFPYLVGHLCNNKICCNPEHLVNCSMGENLRHYHSGNNTHWRHVQ